MKFSLGFVITLMLAPSLILLCRPDPVLAAEPEDQQKQPQPQKPADLQPDANENVVSKFEQFKQKYQKRYGSAVEEMRRQVLFASNSFTAFVSQLRFKHKKSSSFQRVSDMSDWTPAEFEATLMDADDYYREMQAALLEQEAEEADRFNAASDEVSSEVRDLQNEAVGGTGGAALASYARSSLEAIGRSAGTLFDMVDKAVEDAYSHVMSPKYEHRPDLPDEVFVDHRKEGCLSEVRNQGTCGSCYIFSTIALYEWAYCKLNKERVQFAEQYPIDCGNTIGLGGCAGGHEMQVSKFIKKYGFEKRENYEYRSRMRTCVYKADEIKDDRMGALRMEKPELSLVSPAQTDKELLKTPLIIVIYSPDEFHQYGGGLFEGQGCDALKVRRRLHSVLLIGSGREDGHEYWLIRNSYGPFWGERGHFRLRKDSGCVAVIFNSLKLKAMQSGDKMAFNFHANPKHDPRLVIWRSNNS